MGHLRLPVVSLGIALAALIALGGTVATASSGPGIPPVSTTSAPPACALGSAITRFTSPDDWSRTLVDWNLRLPSTYAPTDLVPVGHAGIRGSGTVRAVVIPALAAMTRAARAAGVQIAVASASRSYLGQQVLFNAFVHQLGRAGALRRAALPGHSEHQLGTAIDFSGGAGWLARNAWKYGFVLSYPSGKSREVCYGSEPWHYRFFGVTVAAAIHASGETSRRWLWQHGTGVSVRMGMIAA